MAGTFRFHGEVAHLTGNLKMDTDISHTATGFKSFLLKPLAPFFKKKNAGAVVPIAVTGTAGHYQVSQDIGHNQIVSLPLNPQGLQLKIGPRQTTGRLARISLRWRLFSVELPKNISNCILLSRSHSCCGPGCISH